ncbi:[formate-C-acetyltransferase]-activating enzyme [Rahnella aquatilis]|uniref:Glycyl-radical enzyme activator family protein n=1 Tax=Rahnella aquatilis (strain ATCC 33071 / DSM 4594 / JCM 1683 / NBRC 105701 / NCIMB 13365 / CIP 78.65) TaxID=745277 RepID=H2IVY8_RAHAC|nr:[formate-C-acetyltransferase]-activating enzyme [Rahnella aquatilis]AEX54043.1 glycyl-radical enzyme activator family protein [Rahnella aquatilis CIP 78.65 = ATCC 33071]
MTSLAVPRISSELRIPVINAPERQGRIFNIQRFSLNDGQGIRTLVFFKGCLHRCPWCANPESMSPRIQIIKRQAKCLNCRTCLQDPVECPSGAMEYVGEDITVADLMTRLLKDEIFFRSSGGGVTLSGGEVLMQHAFASELLKELQALGISTAIETAGDAPLDHLLALAGHCDQVLYDFKIMDPAQARSVLNMNQPRVLQNFTALARRGVKLLPRLPLIPGFTLTLENIQHILDFLQPFNLTEIHLLPFHKYGEAKYPLLDKTYSMHKTKVPDASAIAPFYAMAEKYGYNVTLGG